MSVTDEHPNFPPAATAGSHPRGERLREVAILFTRLGFTAFGGPAAHVALMEDEVVHRRNWIDRQHFLDLISATNFIPGPNSTELAIHLGLIRAGFPGLVVAGACFIVPAVLIILPLAWMYVQYAQVPQVQSVLNGINAAVIAIIAAAMVRFGQTALRDGFTVFIAIAAVAGMYVLRGTAVDLPELILLAAAGVLGAIWYNRGRLPRTPMLALVLPLAASPAGAPEFRQGLLAMGLFFLKVGATLYGSGYVLVSYLQSGLVAERGWMTEQQLLDAIAVGQVTPGPLLTTATFIGYLLGSGFSGGSMPAAVLGAVVATAAIFLPSFVFVAVLGHVLPRVRQNPFARGALDAVNAAVVALILVVTVDLGMTLPRTTLAGAAGSILIAGGTLLVILVWNVNTTWLIVAAGLLGWALL